MPATDPDETVPRRGLFMRGERDMMGPSAPERERPGCLSLEIAPARVVVARAGVFHAPITRRRGPGTPRRSRTDDTGTRSRDEGRAARLAASGIRACPAQTSPS